MSEYTPTTEEVKRWFAGAVDEYRCDTGLSYEEAEQGFDRWLAAHGEQTRADERRLIAAAIRDREHGWCPGASANFKRGFVLGLRAAAQIAEGDNR